jgi:hypothetical protein
MEKAAEGKEKQGPERNNKGRHVQRSILIGGCIPGETGWGAAKLSTGLGAWGLGCWEILYQYGFKQGRAMAKPPRPFLLVV